VTGTPLRCDSDFDFLEGFIVDLRSQIKYLIKKQGISVRQLSEKSGVRRQSLIRFLQGGNLHLRNLEKVLTALGSRLSLSIQAPADREEAERRVRGRLTIDARRLAAFSRKFGIRYLGLFGSVLRDDFRKDSDIDVLIDLARPVTFFELAAIEREIRKVLKTDRKLDVVTLNSLSPLLAGDVLEESQSLYEAAA
jgi:predicted nucleotidyltransferase/DNA-binding phage protein